MPASANSFRTASASTVSQSAIRPVRIWPRRTHYTAVGVAFHWTMAALIGVQLFVGWQSTWQPAGYGKVEVYRLHADLGLLILVLASLRMIWRLFVPRPENTEDLPGWQHWAARLTHWALYGLMFALPLTGWLMLSTTAREAPITFFGLFAWPHMPFFEEMAIIERAVWEGLAENAHEFLVWSLLALLGMHVGAALQHQFLRKDEVLARMIPWLPQNRRFMRPKRYGM